MDGKAPISVVIPVKNEEKNIEKCLRSVEFADEIFVVDSSSTDKTVEISRKFTDKIYNFEYRGEWPKKKGWAISSLPFRNEWIFLLDADEEVSEELRDEIIKLFEGNPDADAYFVNRKFYFLGKWIRHCGWYPSWNIRLFKKGKVRFERLTLSSREEYGDAEVHEHLLVDGRAGYLKNDLIHNDLKGIYGWIEKHNRYSEWEAEVYLNLKRGKEKEGLKPSLFGNPVERKRFLKKLWVNIPFRPLLRFFYMYIYRLGFLDGYPGFIFSLLMSYHELMINAKMRERMNEEIKR